MISAISATVEQPTSLKVRAAMDALELRWRALSDDVPAFSSTQHYDIYADCKVVRIVCRSSVPSGFRIAEAPIYAGLILT